MIGLLLWTISALLTDQRHLLIFWLFQETVVGLTVVYIFHTIYPTRQHWQMILAQTKIFNIFPDSVQASSVIRILSSFCSRCRHTYIRNKDLWINWLYFDISNSIKKQCLTIDTRHVNHLGPVKFRTQADNDKEHICYHNWNKRDRSFNSFVSVRKQASPTSEIIFSIVNHIDKTNRNDNICFEINDRLIDFKNDNIQYKRPNQRVSESDTDRETWTERKQQQQYTTRNDRQICKKPRFPSV